MRNIHLILCTACLLLLGTACGSRQTAVETYNNDIQAPTEQVPQTGSMEIPTDSLLPWESLDANGFVDPQSSRSSSAINGDSDFWRGVDAFETEGSASNFGQALRLESGSAGGAGRSFATFRIPLAGENPATLSTDINLRLRDDDSPSSYYIGIANYASGRWDFSGPFSDGRIRLPLDEAATGDYISPLGNVFVNVMAYDGSSFDIVGVALNQFDPGDVNAPPQPTGLTLGSRVGAIELQWNGVLAGDLAGYSIYWSKNSFSNPGSVGVRSLEYLEGGTRHLLEGISGSVFVAVSAVDLNGNESPISSVESATALAGDAPVLELEADSADGIVGSVIALSASGADAYDWDLDGDGTYELTGDVSGSQLADTGKAGIIRPAVRGSDGGTAVALGAVSLIVASDLPPVAVLTANRTSGAIINGDTNPLNVNFDASDSYDDGPSLDFAWDLLGSGSFSSSGPADSNAQGYTDSGIFNAMLRAEDSSGQYAYALLPIRIEQVTGFRQEIISNNFCNPYQSIAVVDGHPAIAFRMTGPEPQWEGLFYTRALDSEGRNWGAPVPISVAPVQGEYCSLEVIAGNPAIHFWSSANGNAYYIRASNSTGQTLADWPNPPVQLNAAPFGMDNMPRLIECSGNPAVLWKEGGSLYFKRATSAAGTGNTAGDWADAAFMVVAANAQVYPDFAMIDGNPAVAWLDTGSNEAIYKRATTSTGASALDWPVAGVVVSGADTAVARINLAQVNGAPAISYYETGISGIKYVRASTSTGELVGDWPIAVSAAEGFNRGQPWHDLAVVGGRPALAYFNPWQGSHTYYKRAQDVNGSAWGNEEYVGPNDYNDTAIDNCELVDLKGFPAITVYHSNFNRPAFYTYNTEL